MKIYEQSLCLYSYILKISIGVPVSSHMTQTSLIGQAVIRLCTTKTLAGSTTTTTKTTTTTRSAR